MMFRLKRTCKLEREDPSTKKAAQLSSERTHSYTTIYCTHEHSAQHKQKRKKRLRHSAMTEIEEKPKNEIHWASH